MWESFKASIPAVADRLKAAKANLRKDLTDQMTSFQSSVSALRAEASRDLPYDGRGGVEASLASLSDWSDRVAAVRQREGELAPGVKVFEPDPGATEDVVAAAQRLGDEA